jgi:hypothetical protein
LLQNTLIGVNITLTPELPSKELLNTIYGEISSSNIFIGSVEQQRYEDFPPFVIPAFSTFNSPLATISLKKSNA